MSMANRHGWEFLLPQDVEVMWDGVRDTSKDHVKILKGEFLPNGQRLVDTTTANGTITFYLNSYIETDPDHYLLLQGPANHFVEGATPMSALLRSDINHFNQIQYCWQMMVPNVPVVFKAGTPYVTIFNYPINLLNSTAFIIAPVTKELNKEVEEYSNLRSSLNEPGFKSFPNLYKKSLGKLLPPNPQSPKVITKNE
jgi:hypothetical protein